MRGLLKNAPCHKRGKVHFALELIELAQPFGGGCIRGHDPIATGREADRADLDAVGNAVALELLGEEALDEDREPFFDGGGVKYAVKGERGKL